MRAALASGLVAVAGTGAVLFAATSSSACPPPTEQAELRPVGPVTPGYCSPDLSRITDILTPQCDPGPCDPTAAAPSE